MSFNPQSSNSFLENVKNSNQDNDSNHGSSTSIVQQLIPFWDNQSKSYLDGNLNDNQNTSKPQRNSTLDPGIQKISYVNNTIKPLNNSDTRGISQLDESTSAAQSLSPQLDSNRLRHPATFIAQPLHGVLSKSPLPQTSNAVNVKDEIHKMTPIPERDRTHLHNQTPSTIYEAQPPALPFLENASITTMTDDESSVLNPSHALVKGIYKSKEDLVKQIPFDPEVWSSDKTSPVSFVEEFKSRKRSRNGSIPPHTRNSFRRQLTNTSVGSSRNLRVNRGPRRSTASFVLPWKPVYLKDLQTVDLEEEDLYTELKEFNLPDTITIRRLNNRCLMMKDIQDVDLFDEISSWQLDNPRSLVLDAMDEFGDRRHADAFVKILYSNHLSPWDAIIKYDPKNEPDFTLEQLINFLTDESNEKEPMSVIRGKHIEALLDKGLIVEYERHESQPQHRYLKLMATFEALCNEAERRAFRCNLSFETLKRYTKNDAVRNSRNSLPKTTLPFLDSDAAIIKPNRSVRFFREYLSDYKGGAGSSTTVKFYFFPSAKRIELMSSILLEAEVNFASVSSSKSSVFDLISRRIYDACYGVHDGPLVALELDQLPKGVSPDDDTISEISMHSSCQLLFRPEGSRHGLYKKLQESYQYKNFFNYLPAEDMRNYFGEEQAFYFAWLGYYTIWIQAASIGGMLTFFYGIYRFAFEPGLDLKAKSYLLFDNELTPFYAMFINVWSILYLRYWKRQSAYLAFMWDTTFVEENDKPRANWRPTATRTSPVTGKTETYVPLRARVQKKIVSYMILSLAFAILCASIVGMLILQAFLAKLQTEFKKSSNNILLRVPTFSTTAATTVFTVAQITILRPLYRWLSVALNEYENHKTAFDYENSLVTKGLILSFVNNFGVITYLAIVRPIMSFLMPDYKIFGLFSDVCGINIGPINNNQNNVHCLTSVMGQVFSILVFRQTVTQLGEITKPYFNSLWANLKSNNFFFGSPPKKILPKDKKLPEYLLDGNLMPFTLDDLHSDYTSQAIQIGFVVMFSPMNPLGPLVSWLFSVLEVKIDAWSRLKHFQRPFSRPVKDIGSWEKMIKFIVYIGIFTNALTIAFVSEAFDGFLNFALKDITVFDLDENRRFFYARILFILAYEHIAFIFFGIANMIPIIPGTVKIGIQSEMHFEHLRLKQRRRLSHDNSVDAEPINIHRSRAFM
ncbi:calcium-activated chloride channel-domain-containing protein [Globomyces pollinis-pini]|nr:calcium-activated chloride channel-domain-containing protein [Globomyces pollinis-pini]